MESSDKVGRLLAIEEIRRLKAAYLNACDLKDATLLLECFAKGDIEIDYGHVGRFSRRETFVEFYLEAANHPYILDMHQGGNAEIDIVAADFAKARWSFDYRNINTRVGTITLASGFYDDEYVREEPGWRIRKTLVTYGTAVHFNFEGGRVTELFAGKSVAGIVGYGERTQGKHGKDDGE